MADHRVKWKTLTAVVKSLSAHRQKKSPIVVAKAACEQEEWPWREPARVEDNNGHWVVVTAPDVVGRRARIVIKKTGQILCKFLSAGVERRDSAELHRGR